MPVNSTQEPSSADQSSSQSHCKIIRQIAPDVIKFIAAGEKISNIEAALKELIENSIDAGSTIIEIRLKNFGIDAIEVEDNGSGIDEKDFNTLAHRYHTSKIRDFKNLQESLQTFGFRGEALSCLCQIAHVTIITKAQASPTGTKLCYADGALISREPIARKTGTTVIVNNLFHSMPVRRKDLESSAKRQYEKIFRLIYEQVMVRPNIKFSLFKKSAVKKIQEFVHGATTLEGCIITIFGTKVMESLMPIGEELKEKSHNNSNDVKMDKIDSEPDLSIVKMESIVAHNREFFRRDRKSRFSRERPKHYVYGYISKIGQGRNSTDCQFIYVNKKPCEIPKLAKTINEIFKNYSNQYPFFCLFIDVQSWAADFNVPRKREVILQDENRLVTMVEDSLEKMFSPFKPAKQKVCPIAQIPVATQTLRTEVLSPDPPPVQQNPQLSESTSQNGDKSPDFAMITDKTDQGPTKRPQSSLTESPPFKRPNQNESNRPEDRVEVEQITSSNGRKNGSHTSTNSFVSAQELLCPVSEIPDLFLTPRIKNLRRNQNSTKNDTNSSSEKTNDRVNISPLSQYFTKSTPPSDRHVQSPNGVMRTSENNLIQIEPELDAQTERPESSVEAPELDNLYENCLFNQIKHEPDGEGLAVSIENVDDLAKALIRERAQRQAGKDSKEFNFAINPKFNDVAVQELKLNLTKRSFEEMQVIGQFNKGFIITRLNSHLFIIDQHATDERANYEEQIEISPLQRQAMVRPKPLYLNALQENIIKSNLDAFKQHGLEFVVDEIKPPGYRVMLSATSICKGQGIEAHLGREDIEELIDVISDSPNLLPNYTLKKVLSVAAMRACRKSVMIGSVLTWSQMKSIVGRMSGLKNPWICAHDRPTIRHLMNVDW